MWFRFPKGTEAISVEQQEFRSVCKDPEGFDYFQAPEHFAPRILDIKGFMTAQRPANAPDEVQDMNPKRDGALEEMARKVETLTVENMELRTNLNAISGQLNAEKSQHAMTAQLVVKITQERDALKERLAEFEDEEDTNKAVAEQGGKPKEPAQDADEDEDD